jgi:flagellar protein FliL
MAKEKKEEVQEEAPPAPPKLNRKKKFLFILLAIVVFVVVGGVAGVVYLMTHKPAAHQTDMGQGEGGAAENDEHPPIYEKLDTFTVNLADQESYLQVEIVLKVADSQVQEKVKARMPEVRDALLRLLSSKSAEDLSTPEGKEGLAIDVQKEINRTIGARKASEGVRDVLFTAFIIQ